MTKTLSDKARALWHIQRVKRLARDRLGPGAACLVSVREAICPDPACPGPATELRIVRLNFHETRVVIHKPPAQVQAGDMAPCF